MAATTISFEDYTAKVENYEIKSHSIDRVNDKHGQIGWSVSGFDEDENEFVAVMPFGGTANEVRAQLREVVGLDDDISGPNA